MAFRKAKNILGLKSFAAHSSVGHLKYSWEEGPEREPSHQRIQFPRLSKSRSYGMRGRTERWCIWWSSGSSSTHLLGIEMLPFNMGSNTFEIFLEFWISQCPDITFWRKRWIQVHYVCRFCKEEGNAYLHVYFLLVSSLVCGTLLLPWSVFRASSTQELHSVI